MFNPTFDLYIQALPGRLVVENPESGQREEATGQGFDHPRLLVGDFAAATATLKGAIERLAPSGRHRPRCVLFHVRHEWEGGLSQVDVRALLDLALASASTVRKVNVYEGPSALSPADVQRLLHAKWKSEPGLVG
jgi:hypothetical protein